MIPSASGVAGVREGGTAAAAAHGVLALGTQTINTVSYAAFKVALTCGEMPVMHLCRIGC